MKMGSSVLVRMMQKPNEFIIEEIKYDYHWRKHYANDWARMNLWVWIAGYWPSLADMTRVGFGA